MSAQPVLGEERSADSAPRPRLVLLNSQRPVMSNFGFGVFVAVLAAVGLALVMVVSTSVAAQSKDLSALRKEATELGYTRAALTTQLQSTSSSASLALRAADLGMVPNPYPAFIDLSDGSILGEPTPVKGNEAAYLRQLPPAPVVRDAEPEVVAGANLPLAPQGGNQ